MGEEVGRRSLLVNGGVDMLGGGARHKMTGKNVLMADSSVLGKVGGRRELGQMTGRGKEEGFQS